MHKKINRNAICHRTSYGQNRFFLPRCDSFDMTHDPYSTLAGKEDIKEMRARDLFYAGTGSVLWLH